MTTNTTPHTVTADQVIAALVPLYELLGIDPLTVYADTQPQLVINDDFRAEIRLRKVVARGAEIEDWPIVEHGVDNEGWKELAYEVVIPVEGWSRVRDVLDQHFPGITHPEGYAADSDDARTIMSQQTPVAEQLASGGHPPICPECAQGKHVNCAGTALDETVDEIVPCACPTVVAHTYVGP